MRKPLENVVSSTYILAESTPALVYTSIIFLHNTIKQAPKFVLHLFLRRYYGRLMTSNDSYSPVISRHEAMRIRNLFLENQRSYSQEGL